MARADRLAVSKTLRKFFPTAKLRRWARESGASVRLRRIDPIEFFWVLVFGFSAGSERSIAALRRSYERVTGKSVEESSFYNRFNPGLVKMLKQALAHAFEQSVRGGQKLEGILAQFADVLITDSTVIRLHRLLSKEYPACRTNHTHAALKAHMIMSVTGASRQKVKVTSERVHDGPALKIGSWVRAKLLLFDLGYFRYQLFARIHDNGGFFVARLKENASPLITAVHQGRGEGLVGEKLKDILDSLKRKQLDIEVEVGCVKRRGKGKTYRSQRRFRVVGQRDQNNQWRLYITNVASTDLQVDDVCATYALRWQVELLFRELKSCYRAAQLPSRNPQVVEALIYAAIITLLVSRELLSRLVRTTFPRATKKLPTRRFARLMAQIGQDLLALVLTRRNDAKSRSLQKTIRRMLETEAPDPNRTRLGLLQQIENRTHRYSDRPRQNATKHRLQCA